MGVTWLAVGVLTVVMCVVALAVAAWVGVTRIADHWHFPHDVLAGWSDRWDGPVVGPQAVTRERNAACDETRPRRR
jgi:hypothetical protein